MTREWKWTRKKLEEKLMAVCQEDEQFYQDFLVDAWAVLSAAIQRKMAKMSRKELLEWLEKAKTYEYYKNTEDAMQNENSEPEAEEEPKEEVKL